MGLVVAKLWADIFAYLGWHIPVKASLCLVGIQQPGNVTALQGRRAEYGITFGASSHRSTLAHALSRRNRLAAPNMA